MKTAALTLDCNLTSPELQERKRTIIKALRQGVLERKEREDGYSFRFPGDDKWVDQLSEFIKTERACCSFFTFELSVAGDGSGSWLHLRGPSGVKAFIRDELEFV